MRVLQIAQRGLAGLSVAYLRISRRDLETATSFQNARYPLEKAEVGFAGHFQNSNGMGEAAGVLKTDPYLECEIVSRGGNQKMVVVVWRGRMGVTLLLVAVRESQLEWRIRRGGHKGRKGRYPEVDDLNRILTLTISTCCFPGDVRRVEGVRVEGMRVVQEVGVPRWGLHASGNVGERTEEAFGDCYRKRRVEEVAGHLGGQHVLRLRL